MKTEKILKENHGNIKNKLRRGFVPLWSSRSIALGVGIMFLGQITYFATEVVGLGVEVVGILLMASKLFDAFSELAVGFLIDKTKTKLGKGRPYEVFIIPFWISVIFLFNVPNIGQTGKIVYIFILYTLAMSVFQTLLSGAETVYLGRAVKDQVQRGKVMAYSGVLVMFVSVIASMILPQLIKAWGEIPGGWSKIAMVYAIPMGIIGMLRFFFIKEQDVEDEETDSRSLSFKESISILLKNKYIIILGAIIMLSWLVQNIISAVGTYYYLYILGDIGLMSISGLLGILAPLLLLLFPWAIRTIGSVKYVKIGLVLAAIGSIIKFIAPTNLPVVVVGTFLTAVGSTTVTMLNGYFILQCIEYGQWKTGKRLEGLPTSFANFAGQVGNGLASLLVGFVMGIAGYISNAQTQTVGAERSIVWLFSLIPALICIGMIILLQFFDVEKKLEEIKQGASE